MIRASRTLARALCLGGALVATGASASEPVAPIPPPRPGLVESPKGDGRQLTPMRRTTHEERFNAALRAAQRRKELEARRSAPPSSTSR